MIFDAKILSGEVRSVIGDISGALELVSELKESTVAKLGAKHANVAYVDTVLSKVQFRAGLYDDGKEEHEARALFLRFRTIALVLPRAILKKIFFFSIVAFTTCEEAASIFKAKGLPENSENMLPLYLRQIFSRHAQGRFDEVQKFKFLTCSFLAKLIFFID